MFLLQRRLGVLELFAFWPHHAACGISFTQQGIDLVPPAVGVHRTTGEAPPGFSIHHSVYKTKPLVLKQNHNYTVKSWKKKKVKWHSIILYYWFAGVSLMTQAVNSPSAIQEIQVRSLGREDPLEEEMQPTPVFLPGKSHGQRESWWATVLGVAKESNMT